MIGIRVRVGVRVGRVTDVRVLGVQRRRRHLVRGGARVGVTVGVRARVRLGLRRRPRGRVGPNPNADPTLSHLGPRQGVVVAAPGEAVVPGGV